MVEESGIASRLPARVGFSPTYYSHGMAANPPPARTRVRPGSLERPVNARLYRGTWLLVGIPLLIAAFSVGKPTPLKPAVPALPAAFDKARAVALTRELAQTFPDRSPGSPGAESARQWFADQMAQIGLRVHRQPFSAEIPGRGRVRFENLIVTIPGRSPEALAVLAHMDNVGTGPGANDNASGVAALVELARSYAGSVSGNAPPGASIVSPAHTLFFVATDGGEFGGLGADRFAAAYRNRVVAALVLDSIAGPSTARLAIAGITAREASAGLVETTAARVQEQTGVPPRRPGAFAQLLDLAFPFTLYEQGPALSPLAALGWVITRARLAPKRPTGIDDELAGHTAALLALGVVGLLVVATNPYALVLVLPSLHAWLWLPQLQSRPLWARLTVFALGFLGPLALIVSFATRYGLGLDAPWYLAELVAIRYVTVPTFLIWLAWLAVAAQLAALAARRYAPYPNAAERGLGPIRAAIRRAVLAQRARRAASAERRQATGG